MRLQELRINLFFIFMMSLNRLDQGLNIWTLSCLHYVHDIRICIVHTLSLYLERTRSLRTSSKLFISTVRPHGTVSKDTIARWIKATLKMAGVDVEVFRPHSTRAAATSAALRKGVPVTEILKVAGWSKETTFARFYNKPIAVSTDTNFAEAVLGP